MRKKKSTLCILSIMLTLGAASLTAYAAEGWKQSGNNWVYYDSNGSQISSEWRKGADSLWRYLDTQGLMTVNSWVDDQYYVDSNGIMLIDKWQKLPRKTTGWDTDNSTVWYYFGPSGKIATDGWAKVAGKYYYFDSDGAMQTGWVEDNTYYMGEDGAMRVGWMYLTDPDDEDDFDDTVTPFEDTTNKHWYYFQSSGKKYVPDISSGNYKLYKIDGTYYCFGEKGRMQTGWVNMGDKTDGSFENYRFFNENGKVQTGWYSIKPPEDLEGDFNDDVQWYYFSTSGIPKVGPSISEASTSDLVKINGITYLFNNYGNPVYGLRKLRVGSGDEYATYYFGNKATSSVVKGKGVVEEGDGTKSEFYFDEGGSRAGKGYTGVKEGYLFYQGKLQRAADGTRYEPINLKNNTYLVNASGKIAKSTTVKDADGTKYKTNRSGEVIEIDGVYNDGHEEGREPSEPVYWDN
ncbi:MAG: cell wall-binding protein [Clostridium sp.]